MAGNGEMTQIILDSFMFSVAAVAAIPEALSSIVTIVLAVGTNSMAKTSHNKKITSSRNFRFNKCNMY